jgi:hypothetical protein
MESFSVRSLSRTTGFWRVFPLLLALLAAAADDEPSWRSKQIPEWSAEDANQVLFDSPWAKTFTPILTAPQDSGRKPGGIGRELGGVGRDAIGLVVPGIASRRGTGGASQGANLQPGNRPAVRRASRRNLRFAGRARCRYGRPS